jgi:cytochrome c556
MSSATSSSSGTATPDYRAALAARLRGQNIIVPDVLRTIYDNPTVRLNDTDFLTQRLDAWLEKYVPTVSQRAKQTKINTPLASSYFLYNDVASLKKELKADEVDNIIPILVYHHNISAQEAVNMAIKDLEKSYKTFTAAVERLKSAVDAEPEDVRRDVNVWVDACVDLIVRNVAWSLAVPRYLPRAALSDRSSAFKVVL